MKTKVKQQSESRVNNPLANENLLVTSVFDLKNIDKNGIVEDSQGNKQVYLKIKSDDIDALSNEDKIKWMDTFTEIARTYAPDLKLVVATTPVNTSEQQQYFRKLLLIAAQQLTDQSLTEAEVHYWRQRRSMLSEVLGELKQISNTKDDLNFYFVTYAKTLKELSVNISRLQKVGGSVLGLTMLSREDVLEVIYRENNLNDE